jgi:molecular chaperone DnaK
VPAEIKSEIEAKVAEVRKLVEGEDVEAMKAATDELGQLIQKIGASVYETQEVGNEPPDTEAGSSSAESDEDVIEGEVKE